MNLTKHPVSPRSRVSAARRFPTVRPTSWWRFPVGTRTSRAKPITEDPAERRGLAFHAGWINPNFGACMPPTFDWDNFEDIAIALTDKFPELDPYTVRFTDMHKRITELP